MSVYGESDPMVERITRFFFKDKREHITKVNMPNIECPSQHIDIEIPHGSRHNVIVTYTVKITVNLEIESTDKTHSIANNVGRALVKKSAHALLKGH